MIWQRLWKAIRRGFQGAEANRISSHTKPRNLAADQELLGPYGADASRAWARQFVRDNAYAWGIKNAIVSSVVGNGINAQSVVETPGGEDVENVNEIRDQKFAEWCEVCEVNGQYNFAEIQAMVQGELVEAGEVLVRLVRTPSATYRGINRPVPLALEIIEADRLAGDKDTYVAAIHAGTSNRIIRGVEVDDLGRPLAYWIYPDHPNAVYSFTRTPVRVPANEILHLFRKDRIGQTRGVTWFHPVMTPLRDLHTYIENELQSSAVAACFSVAIKTHGDAGGLLAPSGEETTDVNGNTLDYLEPGAIVRIGTDEDVQQINPTRPNSGAEPWIQLMLRRIAVGMGLSYEVVARDYSQTSYSSSRTSQLEDRRRFRSWQKFMVDNLCQPIWDEFCNAAARQGLDGFPTSSELLDDRRAVAAVEWQPQTWEWVDPQNEMAAAKSSIDANMSSLAYETGQRGGNWRSIMYERKKEEDLRKSLGLWTEAELQAMAAGVNLGQAQVAEAAATQSQPTGEYSQMSRLQQKRNQIGIDAAIAKLESGEWTPARAKTDLAMLGVAQSNIDALLADYANDGVIQQPEVANA